MNPLQEQFQAQEYYIIFSTIMASNLHWYLTKYILYIPFCTFSSEQHMLCHFTVHSAIFKDTPRRATDHKAICWTTVYHSQICRWGEQS